MTLVVTGFSEQSSIKVFTKQHLFSFTYHISVLVGQYSYSIIRAYPFIRMLLRQSTVFSDVDVLGIFNEFLMSI